MNRVTKGNKTQTNKQTTTSRKEGRVGDVRIVRCLMNYKWLSRIEANLGSLVMSHLIMKCVKRMLDREFRKYSPPVAVPYGYITLGILLGVNYLLRKFFIVGIPHCRADSDDVMVRSKRELMRQYTKVDLLSPPHRRHAEFHE